MQGAALIKECLELLLEFHRSLLNCGHPESFRIVTVSVQTVNLAASLHSPDYLLRGLKHLGTIMGLRLFRDARLLP